MKGREKSPIRWAGSKKKLIEDITPFFVDLNGNNYFEPFLGSASIFFNLKPDNAIISDVIPDLICLYNCIKEYPVELYNEYSQYSVTKDFYLKIRKKQFEDPIIIASRFLFLNRYCFNGLYRTNKKGQFNVPFSNRKNGSLPTYDEILKYSSILKRAKILHGDFEEVILTHLRKGDYVYLDPPYLNKDQRIFNEYHPNSFSEKDIIRLSNILKIINRKGGFFVLSCPINELYDDILNSWTHKEVKTRRNIAGFSKNRIEVSEYLISNIEIGEIKWKNLKLEY